MKRSIEFSYSDGAYRLQENGDTIFSVDVASMKFDSLRFYQGLYEGKSSAIELVYSITDDPHRIGRYVFNLLTEIIERIHSELKETELDTSFPNDPAVQKARIIPLYDFAVCAGNGDYIDESIDHTDYETSNTEADYALRISGSSMEPTLHDQAIVLVKKTEEISNRDIAIVSVDGQLMCKRFEKRGRGEFLVPDNKESDYREYSNTNCTSFSVFGKVIEITT